MEPTYSSVNTFLFRYPHVNSKSAAFEKQPFQQSHEQDLSLYGVEPVTVNVRDLNLYVNRSTGSKFNPLNWFTKNSNKNASPMENVKANNKKPILQNISLSIPAGSVMAIIGGSGSGKTSLLNVMANRMKSSNLEITGTVLYNNSSSLKTVRNSFLLQQDILQPQLTCRETLRYAADLRLPATTTQTERFALVEEIILELGLKECADTFVGDTAHRGLSGGEKRRLSMGIQLLANPSVIFLDEPTTGLDASSAYQLVKTCHRLAQRGRTFILSIHQPRSDIFFLLDYITILSNGGRSVYSGSVNDVIPYFANLGHHMPLHVNPADFLIDTSAIDSRTPELEEESLTRVSRLVAAWEARKFPPVEEIKSESYKNVHTKAPLLREIVVLAKRQLVVSYRDPMGYAGLLFECTAMSIICGWIFYLLDGSLAGIRSQQGAIYTAAAAQGYLLLIYEIYRLCRIDLHIFDRERNENCITVHGYLISRRLAKCFTEDLFVPLIFSAIYYFMTGLERTATKFFIFFSITLIEHYIAVCFAMMCASISRDFTNASLIGNLMYTIQSMACGFFANASHMPVYVRWTRWIAYVYYAFAAGIVNQFQDYFGECPFPDASPENPLCQQYTGNFVLETLGFPQSWIAVPIIIDVCWAIGFYFLAYLFLKLIPVEVSVAQSPNSSMAHPSKNVIELEPNSISEQSFTKIDVNLENLSLSITKSVAGFRKRKIDILNGVTASFAHGKLNAILGPSGSGKSSLLNLMANRLNSSLFSKYDSSGEIYFNDSIPSKSVVASICSFVTQEDDGLLPSLTVRETLYYAAYLRLPSHFSKDQKRQIADNVILKMGLKYCSDTLIGGEFTKGISGGEKRRVSICVQLLNDPRIILLDEPTSGLDSFTAASILNVLNTLSREGRTVVCTIHQPRSDLFKKFGNILLMAKGGKVAFNGPSESLLPYFAGVGYPCPGLTNPADHVLDIISVNLQSSELEETTRARVSILLDAWNTELEKSRALEVKAEHPNIMLPAVLCAYQRNSNAFSVYMVLLSRSFRNFFRSPHLIAARIGQVAGIAVILALYFAPLKDNYVGITNRLGLTQQMTSLYFVGMLNNMAIYPSERAVFYREYDDGVYGVLPFFAVYTTMEIPFEIITAMLFSAIGIIVPGLSRTVGVFFSASYMAFVIVNCGESIGIIFNTLFLHEGFAINIISVLLSIGSMMGGVMSLNMPPVLKAFNWLSPLKYALGALVNQTFSGKSFSCEGQTIDSTTNTCLFSTGDAVLDSFELKASVPVYLGVLIVCVVMYRLIALAVLKLTRLKIGISRFL